jgi:hypothetical protein
MKNLSDHADSSLWVANLIADKVYETLCSLIF